MATDTVLLEERHDPARDGGDGTAPLTAEQRERWLACRLDPSDAPARVDLWIVDLSGPVDRAALGTAVQSVMARYDALRTVYLADGSGQRIRSEDSFALAFTDLATGISDAALPSMIQAEVRRRFDPERGPLALFWWAPQSGGGRLVLAAHPLVTDEPGAHSLLQAIAGAYSAIVEPGVGSGGDETAPSLAAAGWAEQEGIQSSATQAAEVYWREQLATLPEPLELPADLPRPATPRHRGARTSRELRPETVARLQAFADEEGVTLEDLLTAGASALIHRLSGTGEFFVGLAIPGESGQIGPCERFRPLRVKVEPTVTFRELLGATRVAREAARRHAGADVGAILREMRRSREAARPWFWTVSWAMRAAPAALSFAGLRARLRRDAAPHLEGDLAFTLQREQASLRIEAQFNADVFLSATVCRWLEHYATLLSAAARSPEEPVSRLEILTPIERHEIVVKWNPAPLPPLCAPMVLHRAFSMQAARRPEHPAVCCGGTVVTYHAVEVRSNQLAHQLRALGAGPGRCVALLLDRSLEYAVATLGVLKAGAAFVPVDPEWPEERQAVVLRDCAATLVLTAGRPLPGPTANGLSVVDMGALGKGSGPLPTSVPDVAVGPDDLAYLIYTSGSTGQPKGVMITHRAAAIHMASIAREYRLAADDRSLLFHSVAFDPAIEQLFAPWEVGATVFIRGDALWSGREFSAWVRAEGITAVTLPPLYWLQLLRDWEQDPALAPVGSLRRVLVGGEALPPAVVELWRRLGLTSIRLLNGYGPTECTVTATVHDLPADPAGNESTGRVPIGRPQGPVEAYVLDGWMQPQPIGVAGELCLAGPTLARGYLGQAAMTQERFVPHPFRAGARLYRTGDRARFLADGTIDFCGRADRQVKLGGYRVEPGEIEAALGGLDGIAACAVVVETAARGEAVLAGYVVPRAHTKLDLAGLRAQLSAMLPRYMVPARLVDVPELPRTINGKLDVAALARLGARAREREAAAGEGVAPAAFRLRDEWETRVAAIWTAVLGRAEVAPTDNFFDCGGHSLLAIELYSKLERALGVGLPLRAWLADASFEALVRQVREQVAGGPGESATLSGRFLFPIQLQGDRARLFLFAGGRGCDEDFVVLAALTRALGRDQPVWGVRIGGPDRLQPMHADISAMAADVAHEIREFQPEGPYQLAGECIGGLLAYEVARLLQREGAAVSFLGMINTGCPRFAESFRWWLRRSWVGRAKQTIRPLLSVLRRSRWYEVSGHLATAARRVVRPPHAARPPRADGMPEDPKDYHYGQMLLRYRPPSSPVPLTLLGCETFPRAANVQRWARHASAGVTLVPLPGDTTTCIREYAGDSAARLRAQLPVDRDAAE